MSRIYLDHQATTPLDPRVLEAMLPYFTERFGNAASRGHAYGWEAEAAVKAAREVVAAALGAGPTEIVWTSGATESINLALKGLVGPDAHVVTLATEHPATLDTCKVLGCRVTVLPVDQHGFADVAAALVPGTTLLSVAHANNEIGTVQDLAALGALARERGVHFHVDAAQTFGKLPIDVQAMNIDLLSLSGHKLYGPKGVGALYVRRRNPRIQLTPQLHGGGQERGMRAGTLNVPAIVGLAKATELALAEPETSALRDRLWAKLQTLEQTTLNGHPTRRLAGNLNISFAFAEADKLMGKLPELALSSGSACSSASLAPSHVLRAIGVPDDLIRCTLRIGLGRSTTAEQVELAAEQLIQAVETVRAESPLYQLWRSR